MLKPAARIRLPGDWQGTAEELASSASVFLADCGFDAKFFCTERLVRYYLSRGVLTQPEKDPVDRRKALFGNLQFRQLVLTRLLAERGWDLERVQGQLVGFKGPKSIGELDELLNQLAEPSQAEQLLFQSRRVSPGLASQDVDLCSDEMPGPFGKSSPRSMLSESVAGQHERQSRRSVIARKFVLAAREDVTLRRLADVVEKTLADPSLHPDEALALRELAQMARLAFKSGGKKERWTRVRLAPWCEVNLRVGGEIVNDKESKEYIISEFRRIISDYDSVL
ncbi:MAG: hypothetical protein ACO23N_06625 [Opitutales bacterium]